MSHLWAAASVDQIDVPFGEAVERLCANCRSPLSTDSPILPLGAAVIEVDSLTIWLDREPEDEEDIEAERDAAIALSTGDYPPTNGVSDAEEDDGETGHDEEWERYDRARGFRSRRHEHWRRLHSHLARSNDAVADFPFLAPWADGLQSRLSSILNEERRTFRRTHAAGPSSGGLCRTRPPHLVVDHPLGLTVLRRDLLLREGVRRLHRKVLRRHDRVARAGGHPLPALDGKEPVGVALGDRVLFA